MKYIYGEASGAGIMQVYARKEYPAQIDFVIPKMILKKLLEL